MRTKKQLKAEISRLEEKNRKINESCCEERKRYVELRYRLYEALFVVYDDFKKNSTDSIIGNSMVAAVIGTIEHVGLFDTFRVWLTNKVLTPDGMEKYREELSAIFSSEDWIKALNGTLNSEPKEVSDE